MALKNQLPNPRYAFIAPTYKQAKSIAWDDLKYLTKELPYRSINEQELRLDIERPWLGDKIRISLLSGENYDSILGIYLDGCVIDEYAIQNPIVFSRVVRPLLSDRLGFCIFSSTPRGQNHLYGLYNKVRELDDWFVNKVTVDDSKAIPPEEMANLTVGMTDDEIQQEFYCSFVAPNSGAYYAKQVQELKQANKITKVDHETASTVSTAWDLGISDSTAIWFFQQIGNAIHVIDYIENSGVGLEWYVNEMKKGHRAKYIYNEHLLPHDAAARELGSGKSRQEALRNLGLDRLIILPMHAIDDGIHAVRSTLSRCWFDEEKTFRGIETLMAYEKSYDEKNKIFSSRPKHNWASHGADAFRTLAMGIRSPESQNKRLNLPSKAETDYDIFDI